MEERTGLIQRPIVLIVVIFHHLPCRLVFHNYNLLNIAILLFLYFNHYVLIILMKASLPGFSGDRSPVRAFNGLQRLALSGLLLLLWSSVSLAQSTEQNYIMTRVPRIEGIKDQSALDVHSPNTYQVGTAVQYFDGLGRPFQTVQSSLSPSGKDVVQPYEYDAYGREVKKYQPYTAPGAPGVPAAYRGDALTGAQTQFYSSPTNYKGTNSPFSVTNYEPSPLNRVVEQGAPGDAWQPVPNQSTGHTVKIGYASNDGGDVSGRWAKQYGVNIDGSGARSLADQGAYGQNQLYVTITKDENWQPQDGRAGTAEEYKDKEGRT